MLGELCEPSEQVRLVPLLWIQTLTGLVVTFHACQARHLRQTHGQEESTTTPMQQDKA